jgi:hypothetical protein
MSESRIEGVSPFFGYVKPKLKKLTMNDLRVAEIPYTYHQETIDGLSNEVGNDCSEFLQGLRSDFRGLLRAWDTPTVIFDSGGNSALARRVLAVTGKIGRAHRLGVLWLDVPVSADAILSDRISGDEFSDGMTYVERALATDVLLLAGVGDVSGSDKAKQFLASKISNIVVSRASSGMVTFCELDFTRFNEIAPIYGERMARLLVSASIVGVQ